MICCCCSGGCVSLFANGVLIERMDPPPMYAGVRSDAEEIKKAATSTPSFKNFFGGVLLALDLPLSLVMDTILIPRNAIGIYHCDQLARSAAIQSTDSTTTSGPKSQGLASGGRNDDPIDDSSIEDRATRKE
jgi:uncharacterized protein YceK